MIKKTYTLTYKTSPFKSKLKSVKDPSCADLYLNKLQGWFDLGVIVNPDIELDSKPKIYETKVFKNKIVYKVNSLNFDISNIEIEDNIYKYVIKTSKEVGLFDIKFNLKINDVVYYNNNFYTNSKAYYYNSETDYMFTENVVDINQCKVIYRSEYIEVQTPPDAKLVFNDDVFKPQILNEYSMYIPSFYFKKDEKQIRCIDSDIEFFKYKAKEPNSYLEFKINSSVPYVSKHLNISFSTDTVDVSNSSHCLPLYSDAQYFNILENGSIVLGDKTNYVFKIFKILNPNKVEIIFNNYLKENIDINKNDFLKGTINSYREFNENLNNLNNLYYQMTSVSKEYVYLKINNENSKYIYMNTYNVTKPINEKIKKAKFVDYSYNSKYIDSFDFKNFNSEGISKVTFDNINYKEIKTNWN